MRICDLGHGLATKGLRCAWKSGKSGPSYGRRVPPRLAVFVDRYPELSETFVALEVEALADLGAEIRVEARGRATATNPEAPAGVPVAYADAASRLERLLALAGMLLRAPVGCARDVHARGRWRREEPAQGLAALAPAYHRLRRARVEHLHAHFAAQSAQHAMRLAALLGISYSVTAHAYDIFATPANLAEKLHRAAFATSGCVYTVEALRTIAPGARVHEIVMGIRSDRLRRRAPYPNGRHLLAVGRLVEKKGFDVLIEALRDLPDATLTVVGDGPLGPALRSRAAGLPVTFAGAQPPQSVREHLERADVLVVPSVIASDGDRDSMPVVAKEALAMEVPVVASDLAGLPELVRPGHGLLVAPGDARALAQAITALLARPDREAMGRAGRAHVERHADVRSQTARLVELF